MENDKPASISNHIASAVTASTELLTLIYKDLAQPGVQKVGKALETVLELSNIILLPIKLINEKSRYWFEKHMEQYRKILEMVPEEKINTVPPELGVPIIDKLTHTTDNYISDFFINLLLQASNVDTISSVHPSFVEIVKKLSVDEALIINHIAKHKIRGIAYLNVVINHSKDHPFSTGKVDSFLPIFSTSKTGKTILFKYLTGLEKLPSIVFPINNQIYFENLINLGILIDVREPMLQDSTYSILLEVYENFGLDFNPKPLKHGDMVFEKHTLEVTDFGYSFIKTCTSNN